MMLRDMFCNMSGLDGVVNFMNDSCGRAVVIAVVSHLTSRIDIVIGSIVLSIAVINNAVWTRGMMRCVTVVSDAMYWVNVTGSD